MARKETQERSKRMARKIKTPKVPLSGLDKFIYVIIWLSSFAWLFFFFIVCGIIAAVRKRSDFVRNYREALAGLSCSRCLNGRI